MDEPGGSAGGDAGGESQLPQFEGINQIDHYRLLGIGRGATQEQIKKAFRARQLIYHPDKGGTKELSQMLNNAYQVLKDDTLRREYDTKEDFDDDDIIGDSGAFAHLNAGEIPSDRWKEKIDEWQQQFSQFIIKDNFSTFFMELFANTDNIPEHDYFHCDICDRDFVSSEEHYEMFLHSYLSRYDDDAPETKDLGTTLRSHFGPANYDWKPRTYSNSLTGIWATENWTEWKKIETMMRSYLASKKKVEKIKLEGNPPEIKALNKIPASKVMTVTGRKRNPIDFLNLDKSHEVDKYLKTGDEVRVVINSQIETAAVGQSLPVISYKINSTATFQKKYHCAIASCKSVLIFSWHHCRKCGRTLCSACTYKWRYFELGLNRENSSCRRCMLASAEMNAVLWAEKAKELLSQDKHVPAALYTEISVKYGRYNIHTSPSQQLLIEWGSLTDMAFKKIQYQIAHLLCSAMKDHFVTFSYWKSLCCSDNSNEEWAWALEFMRLKIDGPILSEIFLKSCSSSHSEILLGCFKLEKVNTVSGWVDIAKRCYVELNAKDISYSCLSEARKLCKNSEVWNDTVLKLFQNESHFQLAIWAMKLIDSRSSAINILKTLLKNNSLVACSLVEKYMSVELENWKTGLYSEFPVVWFEKQQDTALVASMFQKFKQREMKNCLEIAAYLAETGRFNFKSGVQENMGKNAEIAMFCAKILEMSTKLSEHNTWLELGLALQSKGEVESARICFLEGSFDPVTLADLFYDKGDHKSAIEYYSMSKNSAKVIRERAEQLRQVNNQLHLLYYLFLVKKLLLEEQNDENIDQVVDIIFQLFGGDQSKLDEILCSILARSLEAPLLPSSRKIHENFITSRCVQIQNISPEILSQCLAACHFLPTTSPVRREFISQKLSAALKANYTKAIYQNDFPLFGNCLEQTTPRLAGVVRNLLDTYLTGGRDVQSLPSPFKSQMLLLQGIAALLANKNITEANKILHQALNAHPAYSEDVASCISRILQKDNVHESLFRSMTREVSELKNMLKMGNPMDLSQFNLICCPIFPREICQFAGFFSANNSSVTCIRKAEKEIRRRIHPNDKVEAAYCYINLSQAAPDGASALACFQMAASYFLSAMDESTDISLKYAFSKAINDLLLSIYFLSRKINLPYIQWYFTRFCISAALKSNEKLAAATRRHEFSKNLVEKSVIGSLQSEFLKEVFSRHFYLAKVNALHTPGNYSALDVLFLNISGREFLECLYNAKVMQPYHCPSLPVHLYSFEKFDTVWRGSSGESQTFNNAREAAMHDLLGGRGWSFEDVQHILDWPLIPRTEEGWLPEEVKALRFFEKPNECFQSFCGFTLDLQSGNLNLLLKSAGGFLSKVVGNIPTTNLFTLGDVSEIFENGLLFAHFSLEQPDKQMRSHPFQEAQYLPQSLAGTGYLSTLTHTDFLLKEFTTGVEVNSKPPFEMRKSSEGLIKRLPEKLRKIVTPLHELPQSKESLENSAHRFWIDVSDIVYELQQSDNVLTCKMGKVKAEVKTRLQSYDQAGNLIDKDTDEDSVESKFAKDFSQNYEEFGKYFPEFLRLKELAKISFAYGMLRQIYKGLEKDKAEADASLGKFKTQIDTFLKEARRKIEYPDTSQSNVDSIVSKVLRDNGVSRYQVNSSQISDLESQVRSQLKEAASTMKNVIAKQLAEVFDTNKNQMIRHILPWLKGSNSDHNELVRILATAARDKEVKRLVRVINRIKEAGIKTGDVLPSEDDKLGNAKNICSWVPATFCSSELETVKRKVYGGVAIRPNGTPGSVGSNGNATAYSNGGRAGRQARLRELANDPKLGSNHRGWLNQELNRIDRSRNNTHPNASQVNHMRNPPGTQLAHLRGFEAAKGFGYEYSVLQSTNLHRAQHRYDNYGRSNRQASWEYQQATRERLRVNNDN